MWRSRGREDHKDLEDRRVRWVSSIAGVRIAGSSGGHATRTPSPLWRGGFARADSGSIAGWTRQSSVRSCPAVSRSGYTSSGTSKVGLVWLRPVRRAPGPVRTILVRSQSLAGSVDTRGVLTSCLSMPVARGKSRGFSSSSKSISGDPSGSWLGRGRCLKVVIPAGMSAVHDLLREFPTCSALSKSWYIGGGCLRLWATTLRTLKLLASRLYEMGFGDR